MAWNRYCLLLIFLLIPFESIFSQEYTMPSFVHAIDACDMDMDGSIDIIASCANEDSIVILYNDGLGNFESYYFGRITWSLLCGCIDDDSIPDIVTITDNLNYIKNYGDRTLSDSVIVAIEDINFPFCYIIDMNNDGWNDLLYDTDTYWGVYKNNGDLTFSNYILGSDNATSVNPSLGFLNDDDLLDILISYSYTNGSQVTKYFFNNGNFNFMEFILNNQVFVPVISEMNNTFLGDITLFYNPTPEVRLYENSGNGNFNLKGVHYTLNSAGVYFENMGDYNRDGYDDFCYTQCFLTGCTDSLYIELNDQNWSFDPAQQYYIGTLNWFRIKSVDLNGDSYPDFYMTGYNSNNKIKILWNNGDGTFSYINPVGIISPKHESITFLSVSPNPFTDNTNIKFQCIDNSIISLKIIDIHGVVLKHLLTNQKNATGHYQCNWNGTDDSGKKCSPGIYVILLEQNGQQYSHKVIHY